MGWRALAQYLKLAYILGSDQRVVRGRVCLDPTLFGIVNRKYGSWLSPAVERFGLPGAAQPGCPVQRA